MSLRSALPVLVTGVLLVPAGIAPAAAPTTPEEARALVAGLVERHGSLVVDDATIALPNGYRYYAAEDARTLLVDLYGNTPTAAADARDVIFAPGQSPLDNRWFIVVSYDDVGHVDDDDAAKIDFDDVLRHMQAAAVKESEERVKAGYPTMEITEWAAAPHYDAATHKLYWAPRLRFGGEAVDTVNYEVRVLGRESTLALTAVAVITDTELVGREMQEVLEASAFRSGRQHEDYTDGDRSSGLGVAAVVAGGTYAAAKTGLLALIIAKAKFAVLALVGVGGALLRRLRRRQATADAATAPTAPDAAPVPETPAGGGDDAG